MNDYLKMENVKAQGILDAGHQDILHIDWQLLWTCNYRCSYCFNPNKPFKENHSKTRLLETAYRLLALDRPYYSFRLVGGEPTIHPYFEGLVEYLFASGRNLGLLFITNGSRPPEFFSKIMGKAPPGSVDMHLSVHLEFSKGEHIRQVLQAVADAGQSATVRFMYHPELREESKRFHADLVAWRRQIPFNMRVRALRAAPAFVDMDSRYTEDDLVWMREADQVFDDAASIGPFQPPLPDWGVPCHEFSNTKDKQPFQALEHNQAMRDGLTGFKDFYCCAGVNFLRIGTDYKWKPAVCSEVKWFPGTIDCSSFSNAEIAHPVRCTVRNCGCDANYVIPKYRDEKEALTCVERVTRRSRVRYEASAALPLPKEFISRSGPCEADMDTDEIADLMLENSGEPLLSVIVPVYNTEKFLDDCLKSILSQTYRNIEIIVVNDASPGPIAAFEDKYKSSQVRFVHHAKNRGLFLTRQTGFAHSRGEYIAFVDSDDKVGLDWFRSLINRALETGSDMVLGDFLQDGGKDGLFRCAYRQVLIDDIHLEGDEILSTFLRQRGLDYGWHVVWNKVYKRELFSKICDALKDVNERFISEDIVYSCISFALARRVTNTHNNYYLYNKYSGGTTLDFSLENINNHIKKIANAFRRIREAFQKLGVSGYEEQLNQWHDGMVQIWREKADKNLHGRAKKEVKSTLSAMLTNMMAVQAEVIHFFARNAPFTCHDFENIKKAIIDKEYVSFDVFDTLIVRPFLSPADLFHLLEGKVNDLLKTTYDLRFAHIRIEAEKQARLRLSVEHPGREEITLDGIYREIGILTSISPEIIDKIKRMEIDLELKYCRRRESGYELYTLARYLGKKIIIISDMYLSGEIIETILRQNGFEGGHSLFVSSDLKVTKCSGGLYRFLKNKLGIKNCVHVGDNYLCDVENAQNNGWEAFHLPSTVSMFKGANEVIHSGNFFSRLYQTQHDIFAPEAGLRFLGIRVMLGLVANKIFDNPFISYDSSSDFNCNPKYIGYFTLGMLCYSLARWLDEDSEQYDTIHFSARDGKLIMEAFNILQEDRASKKPTNYLYTSRKSFLPLMISRKTDLDSLGGNINYRYLTPMTLFSYLQEISSVTEEECRRLLRQNSMLPDKMFSNISELQMFLRLFAEEMFSEEKTAEYRGKMKNYLDPLFRGKNAVFDVGYSCRAESLLKLELNYDITAYYMHINEEMGLANSLKSAVKLHTIFPLSPKVTGPIRETCLSAPEPSCLGYRMTDDSVEPVFEENPFDFHEWYILHMLQSSALEFVKDMCSTFGDDQKYLHFRPADGCYPFELFNYAAKDFDRQIFSNFMFDDDFNSEGKLNLKMFWDRQSCFSTPPPQILSPAQLLLFWLITPIVKKLTNSEKFQKFKENPAVFFKYLKNPQYRLFGEIFFPVPEP